MPVSDPIFPGDDDRNLISGSLPRFGGRLHCPDSHVMYASLPVVGSALSAAIPLSSRAFVEWPAVRPHRVRTGRSPVEIIGVAADN